MPFVKPKDLLNQAILKGHNKTDLSVSKTLVSSLVAGLILSLAAFFAITVTVKTGSALIGAILFPIGFIMLNLLGADLLTGVFLLLPLAYLNNKTKTPIAKIIKNWILVFIGNFVGALIVVAMAAFVMTYGFSTEINTVGAKISSIGESRTLGYAQYGISGWITVLIAGVLCNWMVTMGIIGSMISNSVIGKAFAMWMPIMLFFYMGFEHAIVNMFLFPMAMTMGASFSVYEFFIWNEIPVIIGNLVGGLALTGLPLYFLYAKKS